MREGPQTTVTRSCSGCVHLAATPYRVQGDSGVDYSCGHSARASKPPHESYIGDSRTVTPDWCPVVAAPETKALHHMKPSEEAVFSKVLKTHAIDSGTLLCDDCPPASYPTDKTRCTECPRRSQNR
jgi:hypothetical protein